MKTPRMAEAMNYIDDDLVSGAITYTRKKNTGWVKWCALAACLCLVISIAIPVLQHKGGHDPVGDTAPFFFNGCYYETVDDPAILEIYGLPKKITADMAGDHAAYIDVNFEQGFASFEETPIKTDNELYVYAPAPSRGIYVYREGDKYMAAIFCNFETFGSSNTNYELKELYRIFNVSQAGDIASISEVDWHREEVIGATVTDAKEIQEFYDMTMVLDSYGNDDFQNQMFSGYPSEEKQMEAHTAFAGDCRKLRVETKGGLRFYVSLYPSFSWMHASGTMSYYKIDDSMHDWINRNLND